MKTLQQIKEEYALSRKCKGWADFCHIANDAMFARAVDEIATLYAEYRTLSLSDAPPPGPLPGRVIELPMESFG